MKKIVFNPDYILRSDVKRTFIIQKDSFKGSSYGWYSIIHPVQAMIFSFFTKNEDFKVITKKLSEFLSLSEVEVKNIITPFIENNENVYVEQGGVEFYIPKNVLINSDYTVNYIRDYNPEDFICDEYDFKTKRYLKAPLNMTLMPTNNCVTDCIYCYADKGHKIDNYMSFENIIKILDEAKELDCLNVSLVGGEIFVYPNWRNLIKEIKLRGFNIDMPSTKVPITLDDIKYLKSIGIDEIQISLDTLIQSTMNILLSTGNKYHNKIKETITNLSNKGFSIQIATILTKYNCKKEDINSIFEFINELNVESWSISPGFESIYKPNQSFRASKQELTDLFDYIEELNKNTKINISIDKSFFDRVYQDIKGGSVNFEGATCSALASHIFILPNGKVTMCEQLYWNPNFIIGDLTKQSITEVWNSDRVKWFLDLKQENLSDDNPCSTCGIFEDCYNNMNRCWADVIKAYGFEKWDYPDPRCALAPKLLNDLKF